MPYIFSWRGHRNTFFSVKVQRVISVIRDRLLKEAARSVSTLTEASCYGAFLRTIGCAPYLFCTVMGLLRYNYAWVGVGGWVGNFTDKFCLAKNSKTQLLLVPRTFCKPAAPSVFFRHVVPSLLNIMMLCAVFCTRMVPHAAMCCWNRFKLVKHCTFSGPTKSYETPCIDT